MNTLRVYTVVAAYVEASGVATTYQECAKRRDPQPVSPRSLHNKVLFADELNTAHYSCKSEHIRGNPPPPQKKAKRTSIYIFNFI